ncbi:MAG: hypothetical protein H7A49_04250 [Akkermansiaceae bacterium]|nr:hypothetical protein [Akkermansiaceae bacterium]MCP5548757.1 hypothetical protein [Akkermansiaceae bacterium]
MKNPWIFPAAALVVGAVGGFISGKNVSGSDTADSAQSESAIRTRATSRADGASAAANATRRAQRPTSPGEISRMPGASNRIQALMEYYAGLSPDELEDAAGKLDNLAMNERIMASFLLFSRWAEVDPNAAMAYSNSMGFGGAFVRPTILQSWAGVDPQSAAKYYADNPREFAMMGRFGRGPMGNEGAPSIIASEWARQDPAAAMAWASSLTTDKEEAMSAVIGEVAKNDPAEAASMLASMDGDKGDAYRTVAMQYGAKSFSEAAAWVRTLPADEQNDALGAAIRGLSNVDPDAAVSEVAKMEEGDAKNRAVRDVVEDLARIDPQSAGDFLKTQTDEGVLRDGMRELMSSWVNQNANAALTYANSFGEGNVRDSALQSFVWTNNSSNPSELVKVAESIGDERDRERTVGVAVSKWLREDESAAKAYAAQSTVLSDDAKERIAEGRDMFDRGGRGGRGRGR